MSVSFSGFLAGVASVSKEKNKVRSLWNLSIKKNKDKTGTQEIHWEVEQHDKATYLERRKNKRVNSRRQDILFFPHSYLPWELQLKMDNRILCQISFVIFLSPQPHFQEIKISEAYDIPSLSSLIT